MNKEKCSTKYCRNEVVVKHLGKLYCEKCYDKLCKEGD